jgi:hypothetical protein
MKTLSSKLLQEYRDKTFRIPPSLRLHSPQEAIQFVEERGFIFFWPSKGVVMPSLWCAVAGDRPVPDDHDDPGQISWAWKDQLLDKRVWYYARVLKKRNTMVSLKTIPYFYALSPNFGDPEGEIYDQYQQGLIPMEVKLIFETLLEKGPLDTISLRREAHLSGQNSNTSFNRALDILQRDLKILPTSIAEVGTWRYAFVYDLTHRYYPELLEQSRFISENKARAELLTLFMNSVGAASIKEIQSIFGWTPEQTVKTIEKIKETSLVSEDVTMENTSLPLVCLQTLLK